MTLIEFISSLLQTIVDKEDGITGKEKVLFHTYNRHDMKYLSIYKDERKIVHIDIGYDGE